MSTLIAFTPQGRVPYWMMRHAGVYLKPNSCPLPRLEERGGRGTIVTHITNKISHICVFCVSNNQLGLVNPAFKPTCEYCYIFFNLVGSGGCRMPGDTLVGVWMGGWNRGMKWVEVHYKA